MKPFHDPFLVFVSVMATGLIFTLVIALILTGISTWTQPDIKVDGVYEYRMQSTPFSEGSIYQVRVLSVKSGYVQYIDMPESKYGGVPKDETDFQFRRLYQPALMPQEDK